VLEGDELAVRPLRRACAVDRLRLREGDEIAFAPRFTSHGFRYAEVRADPGSVELAEVAAEAVHTDFERTGWFECSHEGLNQLHGNTVWSMRSNFASLPTDCPQRDERLGWTGDIQVFAPAARYLFDCSGLLANWLEDLAWAQHDLGTVPNYVPWLELGFPLGPTAAWGDAAVVVPWTLYERTADQRVLERQFDSMKGWVDQLAGSLDERDLWTADPQLGDWLDPVAPAESPDLARTDRFLIASAYLARSASLVARAAAVLGKTRAAGEAAAVADRVSRAIRREWVSPSGRVVSDTPTALALAITFGLLDSAAQEAVAGRRLAQLVREGAYLVQTGFVGTPLICDALTQAGCPDDAYHLLLQKECPGWLYPVTMGATTIWERWDSMRPDGTVNPGEMTSFNHYAFGSVVDFLHRRVAGLAPAAPGYRSIEVAPIVGGGLEWAATSHRTPYGLAEVSWRRQGEHFTLRVNLPSGVTATVTLPGRADRDVATGPGSFEFAGRCRPANQDPPMPVHPRPAVSPGHPVASAGSNRAAAGSGAAAGARGGTGSRGRPGLGP
jgi:alpha-L-rhamnosidase